MRIPVRCRKQRHQRQRQWPRQCPAMNQHRAGAKHRQGDRRFDPGLWHPRDRQRGTERHDAEKSQRQPPARLAAEQPCQQTDPEHYQQVIDAAEWMREAMQEANRIAEAGMCQCRSRRQRGDQQRMRACAVPWGVDVHLHDLASSTKLWMGSVVHGDSSCRAAMICLRSSASQTRDRVLLVPGR